MVEMTAFTNHRARGERGTDGRPFLLRPVRAGKQKPDPRDPIGDDAAARSGPARVDPGARIHAVAITRFWRRVPLIRPVPKHRRNAAHRSVRRMLPSLPRTGGRTRTRREGSCCDSKRVRSSLLLPLARRSVRARLLEARSPWRRAGLTRRVVLVGTRRSHLGVAHLG